MRSSAFAFVVASSLAFAVAALPLVGAGCSSSEEGDGGPDAASTCATSVPAMAGKACTGTNLTCTVDYACGAFEEQAVCACVDGTFVCGDGQGQVEPGTEPRCASPDASPTQRCPAQYAGTAGKSCTSPWQYCTWAGQGCPLAPAPRLDSCLCRPGETGTLSYDCEPDPCSTDGGGLPPVVDASDGAADAADGG